MVKVPDLATILPSRYSRTALRRYSIPPSHRCDIEQTLSAGTIYPGPITPRLSVSLASKREQIHDMEYHESNKPSFGEEIKIIMGCAFLESWLKTCRSVQKKRQDREKTTQILEGLERLRNQVSGVVKQVGKRGVIETERQFLKREKQLLEQKVPLQSDSDPMTPDKMNTQEKLFVQSIIRLEVLNFIKQYIFVGITGDNGSTEGDFGTLTTRHTVSTRQSIVARNGSDCISTIMADYLSCHPLPETKPPPSLAGPSSQTHTSAREGSVDAGAQDATICQPSNEQNGTLESQVTSKDNSTQASDSKGRPE